MATIQIPNVASNIFDEYLDWDGNVDAASSTRDDGVVDARQLLQPVSPSHTSGSETSPTHGYIPPTAANLPTPSNSSSSPDRPFLVDSRNSEEHDPEFKLLQTASRPGLKRKVSPGGVPTTSDHGKKVAHPSKKRPHNVIEKRYRANLNEKIGELRDSVPSLQAVKKSQVVDEGDSENEGVDGVTPSGKLNKASVLTKAVEYIRHLENRARRLDDENRVLKERLQTLDKVLADGGDGGQRATVFTSQKIIEDADLPENAQFLADRLARHPPQGLIPVPEEMMRLREGQPQAHYGHIYDSIRGSMQINGSLPAKLVLGSIVGLMILDGVSESEPGSPSREKGLFGIPLELLDGARFLRSPRIYLIAFSQFCRAGGVVPLAKGFIALSILAFLIFAYLFNSKPLSSTVESTATNNVKPQRLPSLASPIEVRRRAWLTSMQTLQLPHHSFFPEWLAVTCEWFKFSFRNIFGAQVYSWATGRSEDDEIARSKAWDIAIDSQLAGGDPEVSRSRVVLTSFGSGTLPRTPLRLMLKALHCRVLMWRVGDPGSYSSVVANKVGLFFADREWRRARRLHDELDENHADRLPANLASLMKLDSDEVFTHAVVQRMYNLMYDRPTNENTNAEDELMDLIVEDHAVRSPLDAVAAWWACQPLRRALLASFEPSLNLDVEFELQRALAIAPPGSATETRALALHGVFCIKQRHDFYLRALHALPHGYSIAPSSDAEPSDRLPCFIDSSTPASACAEIQAILHCSMTLGMLENDGDHQSAIEHLATTSIDSTKLTLPAFIAIHFCLVQLSGQYDISVPKSLPSIVRSLCSWLHLEATDSTAIPSSVVQKVKEMCQLLDGLGCKRRPSNASQDSGYGTNDDDFDVSSIKLPSPRWSLVEFSVEDSHV